MISMATLLPLILSFFFTSLFSLSSATDTLTKSHSLVDDPNGTTTTTLVSNDGTFELGFFSPGSSSNRYLGIWYRNIPDTTVVWVANRQTPLNNDANFTTPSRLIINDEGSLVLLSPNGTVVWSANTTVKSQSVSVVAQLLDSGNLVLRNEKDQVGGDDDDEKYIWQSFDYPTDTFLPGMKIGWDLRRGINRELRAWKSWDDPSVGDLRWGMVVGVTPELVMWKGEEEYYRSGPWNGLIFSGKTTPIFDLHLVSNQDELVYTSQLQNKSVITRVVLNGTTSYRQRYNWVEQTKSWRLYSSVPRDNCDNYNLCGPYGNCVVNDSPPCQCLSGFEPKSPQNYNALDWTQGCVRSEMWSCGVKNRDGFRRFGGLKMPNTRKAWVNSSMTLEDCRTKCLANCSCTAYANLYVTGGGIGCLIWYGELIDLRVASTPGQDLYIRMATSETDAKRHKKMVGIVVIAVTVPLVVLALLAFSCTHWRKRKRSEKTSIQNNNGDEQEDLDLPFYDLATIVHATNDFSNDLKLGQGGFGPVYRGILADGQEIAIKRLSRSSGQGIKEFKNEVSLCAKLQHRNLVKVLGCCIQGEEKMLIYEYMPNKSLDNFLFDSRQSKFLDWPRRFHIIFGIARGLLYLHQDSRLRIIHRDLKASNILLDTEMNPKISDFGMARMFGGDQIEGNTNRIAGTYGYMSPEYAIHGLFSIKSDVFSFGVLLLEIVSGKKNRGASYPNQGFNLIGQAWRLWKESHPLELVDGCLGEAFNISGALRCIQVGLLCVQVHPEDRPNMASVIVMLSSENVLPEPKEPGFLIENIRVGEECGSSGNQISSSTNEVTITQLEAR